jgi:hypothetical protein
VPIALRRAIFEEVFGVVAVTGEFGIEGDGLLTDFSSRFRRQAGDGGWSRE